MLIAEHAILGSQRGRMNADLPYYSLRYEDIEVVGPLERHALQEWIPIRTRSGSCIYLKPANRRSGELSPKEARALILSRTSAGATPGESGSVVTPK